MQKPTKRKLPKKSHRAKRRYILFSLKQGSCKTAKQAFDLLLGQFSLEERKAIGLWFIEFNPKTGKGIIRCKLAFVEKVRKGTEGIPGAKTLKTSGSLKALKGKQAQNFQL